MRFVTFVMALAVHTTAASQSLTIKDFTLGEDLKAAAEKGGMSCRTLKDQPGEFCVNFSANKPDLIKTIASVAATRVIISGLEDGKLGSVNYAFSQSDFSVVRSAFTEKYPSMRCVDSEVENRMGAKFEQTECLFTSPAGRISIKRRASNLNEGQVDVTSTEYWNGMRAWAEKRKSEGKKDI